MLGSAVTELDMSIMYLLLPLSKKSRRYVVWRYRVRVVWKNWHEL